ncbi:MAG TPA: hypothetical protein VGI51_09240, partial [Steroidobacteraceae bacterium]
MAMHVRRRQASEKRQGTKSRLVGSGGCSRLYGDLAIALSSMGANRTSRLGMITALSLLEQGFCDLTLPIAYVRAGGFFENFLYGLHVAQGGALPVYYNPTNRKSTMVATNDIGAEVATLLS